MTEPLSIIFCEERKEKINWTAKDTNIPISLLNIDYELSVAILAMRLATVMPSLINEDQTGFIGNRETND